MKEKVEDIVFQNNEKAKNKKRGKGYYALVTIVIAIFVAAGVVLTSSTTGSGYELENCVKNINVSTSGKVASSIELFSEKNGISPSEIIESLEVFDGTVSLADLSSYAIYLESRGYKRAPENEKKLKESFDYCWVLDGGIKEMAVALAYKNSIAFVYYGNNCTIYSRGSYSVGYPYKNCNVTTTTAPSTKESTTGYTTRQSTTRQYTTRQSTTRQNTTRQYTTRQNSTTKKNNYVLTTVPYSYIYPTSPTYHSVCPRCNGSKRIRCDSCNGLGYMEFKKYSPNYGYGSSSYMEQRRCPRCNGYGTIQCTGCWGKGTL